MTWRKGRGKHHSVIAVNKWLLASLKRGTIMKILRILQEKGKYKGIKNILGNRILIGMVREETLYKALQKEGMKKSDIDKYLRELIIEGHIYSPRVGFYKIIE